MTLITEKQKKLMKRLDVSFDDGMTKSEASELIRLELEMRAEAEDQDYNSLADDVPLFDRSTSFNSEDWNY